MPNTENQPLLGNSSGSGNKKFDPIGSTRYLLFGSWLNILVVFIPLAFVCKLLIYVYLHSLILAAEAVGWPAAARFAFSFMAIIPLAKVSLHAVARYLGSYLSSFWETRLSSYP
jgi:Ca2+:H+ antiporter